MTKDEMINKIYEVIADKTLSFWCIAEYKYNGFQKLLLCIQSYSIWNKYWTPLNYTNNPVEIDISEMRKIIWHPVMIGDVLDWLEKDYTVDTKRIIPWFELDKKSSEDWKVSMIRMHYCEQLWFERTYKRKPINSQSEECITFIYNLITSHVPKKESN